MENNELNKSNMSNIILGTSSEDIERGLQNDNFTDNTSKELGLPDDPEIIVNEQEQNEIVNPAEERFNEGLSPEASGQDKNRSREQPSQLSEPEQESYDDGSADPSTNTSTKSPIVDK